MTTRSPLFRTRPADVLVDRVDFAAYVLLWKERSGCDRTAAFRAVDIWLDGWQREPFTDAEHFRKWLSRTDEIGQVGGRKLAIELENRHSIILSGEDRGDPFDSQGGTLGGILPVPSATNGLHTETRREVRKADRAERDRFIRQTIETLTERVEREPQYIAVVIRKYAEAIAR